MLSEWVDGGNISRYLENNPGADRFALVSNDDRIEVSASDSYYETHSAWVFVRDCVIFMGRGW